MLQKCDELVSSEVAGHRPINLRMVQKRSLKLAIDQAEKHKSASFEVRTTETKQPSTSTATQSSSSSLTKTPIKDSPTKSD